MHKNKKWAFFLGFIVLLVVARLLLPYFVTKYVNKVLADIDGYTGSIEDVDISLWRGAYSIDKLKIEKIEGDIPAPFLDIERIDLSVEWSALFDGAIVGEIILIYPELNFVAGPTAEESQTGAEADWTEPIKELMPLQINRFEIQRGKIAYMDFHSEPQVDISIDSLNAVALNLNNATDDKEKLPSDLKLTGTSIGGGQLLVEADMNLLKEIPDFDVDLEFTGVNLPDLNDFIKAYGKFDVERGTFELYSEIILNDGSFEGYVKPLLIDMKVLNLKEDVGEESIFRIVWEGIVEVGSEIFENHPKDQVATRVPLEGEVGNVTTDLWTTIFTVLKNAYIEALTKEVDNTLNMEE